MTKYLPQVDWSSRTASGGVTEAGTLNATASSATDRQLTLAAENAFIRTVYGVDRIGAQIANIATKSGFWYIQCVWCEGEISSIDDLRLNDESLPTGATATHYTGTAGQGIDPWLAAVISGYADTLPGIAYSVIKVPVDALDGVPQIAATITGLIPSGNPALILRDFIIRATGRSVNEASFTALAADCDALVSGVKRRVIGLTMDSAQEVWQWIATLRAYASCWLTLDSVGAVKAVPDKARASDGAITHAAGQIKSISLKKRGRRQVPTVVRVRYTNTSSIPWRDDWAEADSGETPRRESEVALPGIHNASQALREAIERLNKQRLCDLSGSIEVFDEALEIEVGDVREVTHPYGLNEKPVRVLGVEGDYGRYKLAVTEYDPAVYSDAIASDPTYPDTSLPSPIAPPTVTGLALAEENYVTRDGYTETRFRASWTAPAWAWPTEYRVIFSALGVPDIERRVLTTSAVSDQVVEGTLYQVQVFTLSGLFASDSATATATAIGKGVLPDDVPKITAFEVGGEIRVTIDASLDKDLKFYELRYDDGSLTYPTTPWADIWAAATFVDATPAASGVGGFIASKMLPEGTHRLLVCALDSVDQYSEVPATTSITVTRDESAMLVGDHEFGALTLTGMVEYSLPGDPTRYFVTEDGVTAATKFPTSPASSYGNIAATYHASQDSRIVSEAWDVGTIVSGNWDATLSTEALAGVKNDTILVSSDATNYTDMVAASVKATGRWGKVQSSTYGTDTLKASLPSMRLRIDAVPRTENSNGDVTTSASAATPIVLAGVYTAAKSAPVITPIGSAARQIAVDNITTCPYSDYAGAGSFRGNGSSAYVSVPTAAAIEITSGTLEVLFLARAIPSGTVTLTQKVTTTGALDTWSIKLVGGTGVLRTNVTGSGVQMNADSAASVCDGLWHRASLVFSSTFARLYMDGLLVGETTGSVTFATNTTSPLGIGARPPNASNGSIWDQFIPASIQVADVRLWSTQRTAQQMYDTAFSALAGTESGLVGYWPLDEVTGTTADNLVSGGGDGTRTNGLLAGRNGFDIYLFNSSGTQVADKCRWAWEGV